jgi:hypothetical protein
MTAYVRLGDAWNQPVETPPAPSSEEVLLDRLLARLDALVIPAPVVEVERISDEDVAQIVQSVIALAGPKQLTEERLAEAIRQALPEVKVPEFPVIPTPADPTPALDRLADRFEKLENLLRGIAAQSARAYGSSGPSNIASDPNRLLGHVDVDNFPGDYAREATLADVKRSITDYRTLLDYDNRVDGNPVYVGKNLQTAAQSAATWTIQRLNYDLTSRLTDVQVLTGVAWTGRAGLGWT